MRATIDGPATGSGTAISGGCDAAVQHRPAVRVAILPYRRHEHRTGAQPAQRRIARHGAQRAPRRTATKLLGIARHGTPPTTT
jgi:hypothetical protein